MESVTCLSSCSVVLRYLVSGAGAIHGKFPLRLILFVFLPCLSSDSLVCFCDTKISEFFDMSKSWATFCCSGT